MSTDSMIPEFHDEATFGDLLSPAMEIAKAGDREAAREYVDAYAEYLSRRNPEWSAQQVEDCIHSNLGYFAGYYDTDTRRAVQDVFNALHPFFGSTDPTPEEAFEAGREWARSSTPDQPVEPSGGGGP